MKKILNDCLMVAKIRCWHSKRRVFVWFFVFCFCFCFCFLVFLGPDLRYIAVPRLGVKSELQLPAYATVTATWDLSWVCNLHHRFQQCRILNPLSEARDQTCILVVRLVSPELQWELPDFFFFLFSVSGLSLGNFVDKCWSLVDGALITVCMLEHIDITYIHSFFICKMKVFSYRILSSKKMCM